MIVPVSSPDRAHADGNRLRVIEYRSVLGGHMDAHINIADPTAVTGIDTPTMLFAGMTASK